MELLTFSISVLCLLFIKDVSCDKRSHIKANDERIVGGYSADIRDIPYQAHLTIVTDKGRFRCGGSIMPEIYFDCGTLFTWVEYYHKYIATFNYKAKRAYIRVGSNYANKEGVTLVAIRFWKHPKYDDTPLNNDVGIVSPVSPIRYSNNIKPITLVNSGAYIPAGTEALVSGWGAISENGPGSDVLLAVKVPTISNEDCGKVYGVITENMICAGLPQGGKDSCQGDSGGPAASNNKQIGIVSFGFGCARPNYPGVYSNVASPNIRNWIKTVTGI